MNPAEFRIKALAMNITTADLAAKYEVDTQTAAGWLSNAEIPLMVAEDIQEMWLRRIDKIGETIDLTEQLGEATLLSYVNDDDCAHFGMTADDHSRFLVQVATALELADLPYRIETVGE